jgi:DNA invertase Pin-like site-specific DNA recombinase
MHLPRMSSVYSYARFSTPEQAGGDSLRRQTEAARRWAESRGLPLDEKLSLTDHGVSAYRGTNSDEDRGLGAFLYACRQGLIPLGSYLLVESLDRISRMSPRKAQRLIDDIVDAGVTIVTLNDGQEYTAERLETDPTALFISLMVAWRAHEESKTKGRRVAAAWAEKRRRVRSGEAVKLTERAPGWLEWTPEGWIERFPHGDTVRRAFAMTIEGHGEHNIAAVLNAEGVPVMGKGVHWHRSTIAKLLRNPAVIGLLTPGRIEFTEGKRRRVSEEPIPGAYPAVIEERDWLAVRAMKDGAAASVRGRHTSAPLANIFGGLARCPECGETMTRVNKGNVTKGGKPKLVCVAAKSGRAPHPYRSVSLDQVTDAFLSHWQGLLAEIPAGDRGGALDLEVGETRAAISGLEDHLERILDAVQSNPSAALAGRVRQVEEELKTYRAMLHELEEAQAMADHGLVHSRMSDLATAVEPEDGEAMDLGRVNAALKVLFSGITVDYRDGRLKFHWRQGGEASLIYAWVEHAGGPL